MSTGWIKRCITMGVEETKARGRLRKTWWDGRFGLSRQDALSRGMEMENRGASS